MDFMDFFVYIGYLTGTYIIAVGLIALAAYQLSRKAIADRLSAVLLFISGAVATCYQAEWTFPVLSTNSTTLSNIISLIIHIFIFS